MDAQHPGSASNEPEIPQIRQAWKLLKRRRWPFITVFVVVMMAMGFYHLRQTPLYRSTASVEITRQLPRTGTMSDLPATDAYIDQAYYNTQQKILGSRALAERTVRRLGWKAKDGTPADPDSVLGGLEVSTIPRSQILTVSFSDPDPKRAADVANAVVAEFAADAADKRLSNIRELQKKLEAESKTLQERFQKAEEKLQDYNEKHQLTGGDERQSVVSKRLEEATMALTRVEQEVAQLESLVEQAKPGDGEMERYLRLKPVIENRLMQELLLEENRTQQELSELSKRFKPRHPTLQASEQKLKDVRVGIEREARKIAEGLRQQHQETQARREKARATVEDLKREKIALDRIYSGAEVLRRDRDATKGLYDVLIQRAKESDIFAGIEITNVSLVDGAIPAGAPSKPSLRTNGLLGLVLAAIFATATVITVERLDASVKTIEEIEEAVRLPILGVIPDVKGPPETVSIRDPKALASEGFRTVRTSLMLAPHKGKQPRSFLVVSSGPNEGKTVNSINLAVTLAQSGQRVLLVDADFHRPQVHKHFDLDNAQGFSTSLVTEGPIEGFTKAGPVPGLTLLPTGPVPPQPAELLGTAAFAGRLEEMLAKFDKVVIDSPPVCAVTDGLVMAPHLDVHVLVVQPGLTARDSLKRAMALMKGVGVAPIGVVINRVPERAEGYSSYYKYYGYSKA